MARAARTHGIVWSAAALLALSLALAGCGRKGALEPPPNASVEGQPKGLAAGTAPAKVPDRPFVLDRLL